MRYVHHMLIGGLIVLGLVTACSPSNINSSSSGTVVTGGGGGGSTPTPGSITLSFTNVVTGATVTSIPSPPGSVKVNATVRDTSNNLMSGVTVTFVVSATPVTPPGAFTSTGTLTESASTTVAGVATVQFDALNVDTTATFSASVLGAGGVSIISTAQLAIGTPPPPNPTNLTLAISPLTVNIQGTATVTATATSAGNPAFNTPIQFDIISGSTTTGDSFSPSALVTSVTLTTGASGVATATFYAGTASGTDTIKATATAATPTPLVANQSISITSSPNSVNLTITPNTINTSGSANISAQVLNILGSPVPDGTQVTFSCIAGNCGIGTFSSQATTLSGTASVTFTASATVTGSAQIEAVAGTAPPGTANISVNPLSAGSIVFVSATPQLIGIQGSGVQSTSLVTFLVNDQAGNPLSGQTVNFTLYGPTGTSLLNATGSSGSDGKISTTLAAGTVPGPARVVAWMTVGGATISTSSGNISIGGGVPSASHFDLATSRFNLDGLSCDGVTATITAFLADRYGNWNVLQGTSVSFATEAGAINAASTTGSDGTAVTTLRTQAPTPEFISDGNPKNGWVSVVAMTTGEEAFTDVNANGVYDSGEPFIDIGKPFIDANHNGVYDIGEQFFDWPAGIISNVTNSYQTGNGVWDAQIPIWKEITLVFTGPPDPTNSVISSTTGTTISIAKGASATFTVTVADVNNNTLIAGTTVSIASSNSNGALTISGDPTTLPDGLSYGPSVYTVVMTNNNPATSGPVTTILSATINWPGSCGTIVRKITFPGTITLQ